MALTTVLRTNVLHCDSDSVEDQWFWNRNANNATQCVQCCQTYINMRTTAAAVQFQTIIPFIDKLSLLIDQKRYLQSDGSITESDLSVNS